MESTDQIRGCSSLNRPPAAAAGQHLASAKVQALAGDRSMRQSVTDKFRILARMCSHYQAAKRRDQIERRFGVVLPADWEPPPGGAHIYPTQLAPIVRRPAEHDSGDEAVPEVEVVNAHFGLLPGLAKDIGYGKRTYNSRSESAAKLASFRNAWAKARHCIVPCEAIYEPDWRSGKHVPTRFTAADGDFLGVAGLWQPWRSPETGEWLNSFCMLKLNADDHDLMRHYHRPNPKQPADKQDKRMVAILPPPQYKEWLDAAPEQSMNFIRQYPADRLVATPEPARP